jgi:hypothetical protein
MMLSGWRKKRRLKKAKEKKVTAWESTWLTN